MADTLDLLKLTPKAALKSIIQEKMKDGFDVDDLRIGAPVSAGLRATKINLSVDKTLAPIESWKYDGSVDFTYNRLVMSEYFAGKNMTFTVDLPMTATNLVALIADRFDIVFDPLDYVSENISLGTSLYTLKSAPGSLRWVGQVQVELKERVKPLSEVIQVSQLDVMNYPADGEVDSLPPIPRLLESINRLNSARLSYPITAGEVTWSTPLVSSAEDEYDNTEITLSIANSEHYSGSVQLHYRRRYMLRMQDFEVVEVISATAKTTVDLAVIVAQRLGFYLESNDVVSEPLPTLAAGEVRTITVNIKPTSMMYVGEMTIDYRVS